MALVVFISSFLITSVVQDTMANETVITLDMNCRCNSIGFKTVNIIWEPLPQDPNFFSEPVYYRVFFCTDTSHSCDIGNFNQGGNYHLGCTLNTSAHPHSVSQQSKLKCSISRTGDKLFDPHGFYFILEMRNSSGVFISRKKTCRLAINAKCAKPQNVKVTAKGKRNLSISWIPSGEMGDYASFLCYRIWYSSSQGSGNETIQMTSDPETLLTYTINDLSPYTNYTLFIQCSLLTCVSGWGPLSGPIFVLTDEEVPAKAPEFENNNYFNVCESDDDKRNESLFWKLPPMKTWNGILKKFKIHYLQVSSKESYSNLTSVSNRLRMVEINDGSAKEATLIGLNRFDDYEAEISMCNSKGCGPRSGPLVLRGDNEGTKNGDKATSKSTRNNSLVEIVAGTSSAVVFLSIIVCVVYKFYKSRGRREIPLNNVWNSRDLEPHDVEEVEPVPSIENSYDVIHVPRELNTNIPLLDELQIEQGSSEVDA